MDANKKASNSYGIMRNLNNFIFLPNFKGEYIKYQIREKKENMLQNKESKKY